MHAGGKLRGSWALSVRNPPEDTMSPAGPAAAAATGTPPPPPGIVPGILPVPAPHPLNPTPPTPHTIRSPLGSPTTPPPPPCLHTSARPRQPAPPPRVAPRRPPLRRPRHPMGCMLAPAGPAARPQAVPNSVCPRDLPPLIRPAYRAGAAGQRRSGREPSVAAGAAAPPCAAAAPGRAAAGGRRPGHGEPCLERCGDGVMGRCRSQWRRRRRWGRRQWQGWWWWCRGHTLHVLTACRQGGVGRHGVCGASERLSPSP